MKFDTNSFAIYFLVANLVSMALRLSSGSPVTVFDALFILDMHLFVGIVYGLIMGRKS